MGSKLYHIEYYILSVNREGHRIEIIFLNYLTPLFLIIYSEVMRLMWKLFCKYVNNIFVRKQSSQLLKKSSCLLSLMYS